MVNKKHIMLDLDDPRVGKIADVISNKTAKKIVGYLADNEVSEAEIVRDLKLPANTVNYNIKNLLEAGLIERTKKFFWSVKGKKIPTYRVARKSIVISPKSSGTMTSLLGALVGVGVLAIGVKKYFGAPVTQLAGVDNGIVLEASGEAMVGSAEMAVSDSVDMIAPEMIPKAMDVVSSVPELWTWFLLGGIVALIIFMILNWRRL